MFQPEEYPAEKNVAYRIVQNQLKALMEGEKQPLPNMANMCALLYHALPKLNWCGFYLLQKDVLILGPFQGLPACVRIPVGRGVCGTAAAQGKTQLVPDVHAFPGHIACDSASRSEIVIPLCDDGRLLGVLDIDSPLLNRFDETDRLELEKLCCMLCNACEWPME